MDQENISTAIIVVVGVPAATVLYVLAIERLLRLVPERRRRTVRPLLWLLPGVAFLGVFLIYPAIKTAVLSLMDKRSREFVGLDNYTELFDQNGFGQVLANNALWIVVFTGAV